MDERDGRVRIAAFEWLRAQVDLYGEVLPRSALADGFTFEGNRVPLVGPQGIFKPKVLTHVPLSITTAPQGPYEDRFSEGLLWYAYRGTDPEHPDNRSLREAMRLQLPLVYLYGVRPGRYLPVWPVYIVSDRPDKLFFEVAVDDQPGPFATESTHSIREDRAAIRRQYVTLLVKQRLHQQAFRERVLEAYRVQCALCRLRHQELLDAAHITPDAAPEGEPAVSNGMSLCKLHHAAFDRYFLTVRPDYRIEVRRSILEEQDGPMLVHGLKALHLQNILLPRHPQQQPDRRRLEERYEVFLQAQ
ncbi:MAG: HNH endonuclease [Candidatus Limnocylindria bacterium]